MRSVKGSKSEKHEGNPGKVKSVRNKAKRMGKKHHQPKPVDKKGRIVIRNISFKASKDDIEKHFSRFGRIREVNLLLRPDGNPVGCGFVQFNSEDDATKAIASCNGINFMGRKVSVDWALQRDHYIVSRPEEDELNSEVKTNLTLNATSSEEAAVDVKPDVKENHTLDSLDPKERKQILKKKRIKEHKLLNKVKKGRIIVRNLPFKITEDGLRKHFSSYGELSEVSVLRRPDGKMVGCGFIQFTDRKNAAKAIVECSGKPLLGRPIVLDWAVHKTLYESKNPKKEEDVKIKVEPDEDSKDHVAELDDTLSVKSDPDAGGSDESDLDEEDEEDKSSSDDDEEEEDKYNDVKEEDEDEDMQDEPQPKRPKVISNDVSEGKTVFIKNVPFLATNDDLRACLEKFGPVHYALICVDRLTEHSKGTAFVKFRTTESAEACLTAGTELQIQGQVLDPHRALNRDEVKSKAAKKDSKPSKDSRNLFLVKEGVILAGTPAAVGVSVTDMAKRLQLEQWKSQMLRNLNMFLARDRLAIHNLPALYNDDKLRELFQKHASPNAVIKEARVMRDMRSRDLQGVGKSKETGFVKFTTHEDALQALRKINNNPNIFSKNKRPIVAFSIENRAIHKVRHQRELKSRAKNPTFTQQNSSVVLNKPKKSFNKVETRKQKRKKKQVAPAPEIEAENFSGVPSKPGDTKLRTKFKLRAQAEQHTQAVRKDKSKAKSSNRLKQQKKIHQESIRQPKQKQGKKIKSDSSTFNTLVNNYVAKLSSSTAVKSKWYDA